jgi:hypothetical protein
MLLSVVAEAVWLCDTAALLPLGRQSNEDKRQCTAGDESKTKDACVFDLRSYFGFRVGLDIVKLRMGLD